MSTKLYIGYKQIGRMFAFSTLFSIFSLSVWVSVLHSVPVLTKDVFLASIFGGVILGIGVGLIIRKNRSWNTDMWLSLIEKQGSIFDRVICIRRSVVSSKQGQVVKKRQYFRGFTGDNGEYNIQNTEKTGINAII